MLVCNKSFVVSANCIVFTLSAHAHLPKDVLHVGVLVLAKVEEDAERELKAKEEQLLRGNPLVNRVDTGPSFQVKRR